MWLTIVILFMLYLGTGTILNIIKIFEYLEMRRASTKLADIYEEFKNEHIGECEHVGKHAKEE